MVRCLNIWTPYHRRLCLWIDKCKERLKIATVDVCLTLLVQYLKQTLQNVLGNQTDVWCHQPVQVMSKNGGDIK